MKNHTTIQLDNQHNNTPISIILIENIREISFYFEKNQRYFDIFEITEF